MVGRYDLTITQKVLDDWKWVLNSLRQHYHLVI